MSEQYLITEIIGNETTSRPMTEKEVKELLELRKEALELQNAEIAKTTAKNELLAKLGITDDEAKLLLG